MAKNIWTTGIVRNPTANNPRPEGDQTKTLKKKWFTTTSFHSFYPTVVVHHYTTLFHAIAVLNNGIRLRPYDLYPSTLLISMWLI